MSYFNEIGKIVDIVLLYFDHYKILIKCCFIYIISLGTYPVRTSKTLKKI